MPSLHGPQFVWDHTRLTTREDMMVKAITALFFSNAVTARMVTKGRTTPTAADLADAEKTTVEFCALTFPDLNVRVAP
jgi:hypothetical protein